MLYLYNVFIFDVMKSSNYIFFSFLLILLVLSCNRDRDFPENSDCHCGEIVETTTGDGGINPYPTTCGGTPSSGTDNGRALISNNCSGNIKVVCTGPVWFTVSGGLLNYPIGSQWCDPTGTSSW